MNRRWVGFAVLVLATVSCAGGEPAPRSPFSPAERAALTPVDPAPIPLRLVVPAEGTVVPWTFPGFELRWEDGFQADAFHVRIRDPKGAVVVEGYTSERRYPLGAEAWGRVRAAVKEGGAFEVELVAASLPPDGRALRGPTTQTSRVRFSGPGEHPTGHVYYSVKERMPGVPPGPMTYDRRLLVPMRVGMDGTVESVAQRLFETDLAKPGEPRIPGWEPPLAEPVASRSYDFSAVQASSVRPVSYAFFPLPEPRPGCSGCHTASSDGRFMAVIANEFKGETLVVVRLADRSVVYRALGGLAPRFDPGHPDRLAYSVRPNEMDTRVMGSFYRADVRVADLATGASVPVEGASEPDRCEIFPDWAPDGRALVFSRSPPGEPCDGTRGRLEIARVPWDGEHGGAATVLVTGVPDGESNAQPRFSPDGRWIVFTRAKRGFYAVGSADLWVVAATGGEPRRLDISTDAVDSWHSFSPDGRWLAFQSNRERVDHLKGYVARFFDDGRVAPAVPLPGAGDREVQIIAPEWGP